MHIAAAKGHSTVVEALLAANADAALGMTTGRTAVMEAASFGHVAVVEALIQHAATKEKHALTLTSAADKDGWTALHDAAYRGHDAVIDALLGPAVEWGRGTTLLSADLAHDVAAGAPSAGDRCTAEQLAHQHGETEVLQVVGSLGAACSTPTSRCDSS
eukprot:SAG31_NODE_1094_length_9945_cov_3.834349_11_plen_159_part_00